MAGIEAQTELKDGSPRTRSLLQAGRRTLLQFASFPRLALDCRQVCSDINLAGSTKETPLVHISLKKPFVGGVGAGILYDLTGSQFGRRTAQLIGARATAAIWVTDYLIDDFQLPNERKTEVLSVLLDSLKTGRIYQFKDLPQLDAISRQFSRIWRSLEDAPYRSVFEEGFGNLRDVAVKQIHGDCSLNLSVDIGSKALALISRIVSAWNPSACRVEPAVSHLGGFLQLFDDLYDMDHDWAHGIKTFATEAASRQAATDLALPRARSLLDSAYMALPRRDHWALDALYFGALYSTKQLWAFRNIVPRRPTI